MARVRNRAALQRVSVQPRLEALSLSPIPAVASSALAVAGMAAHPAGSSPRISHDQRRTQPPIRHSTSPGAPGATEAQGPASGQRQATQRAGHEGEDSRGERPLRGERADLDGLAAVRQTNAPGGAGAQQAPELHRVERRLDQVALYPLAAELG